MKLFFMNLYIINQFHGMIVIVFFKYLFSNLSFVKVMNVGRDKTAEIILHHFDYHFHVFFLVSAYCKRCF